MTDVREKLLYAIRKAQFLMSITYTIRIAAIWHSMVELLLSNKRTKKVQDQTLDLGVDLARVCTSLIDSINL